MRELAVKFFGQVSVPLFSLWLKFRFGGPEDVLKVDAAEVGNGEDDAADCLRYLVATKGRVVAQRKLRGL